MEIHQADKRPLLSKQEDKETTAFTGSVSNPLEIEESPIIVEQIQHDNSALKKLWIVSVICLIFMIIEIIGGYLANSIAIMADAAHLLSDLLGFLISIASIYVSKKQATSHMSFGYHRAEVIGALVSVNIIWGLTIWLLYEATLRLVSQNPVDGLIMVITALVGFVFNVVMGVVLAYQGIDHYLHHHHDHEHDEHDGHSHGHECGEQIRKDTFPRGSIGVIAEENHSHEDDGHHHSHSHNQSHTHDHDHEHPAKNHNHGGHNHKHSHGDVNLRAALIHVIGDAIQNLGVVIAGVIIYFWPHLSIADPICTFIFSIIIIFTTIRILNDCIAVLMEGSPVEFNMDQLSKDLLQVKGVLEIHDLHVWSLSVGKLSLSCHLISNNPQISLSRATKLIRDKYKITHSTIQVEINDKELHDCTHDLH
jgi:zinc transporter 2